MDDYRAALAKVSSHHHANDGSNHCPVCCEAERREPVILPYWDDWSGTYHLDSECLWLKANGQ